MIESKAWDWSKNKDEHWLIPAVESCYLAEVWKERGFKKLLDLGCGLGRHSIYFARKDFEVNSVDLSEYGVNHLINWAEKEQLNINAKVCDMLKLPFEDESFDCILAYNVIYHTDKTGFMKALGEIKRVLKKDGELFITLISKNTFSYQNSDQYIRVDDNTILISEHEGTEVNVPHFYVNIEDIKEYFMDFEFIKPPVEKIEYNVENREYYSTHFSLIVRKK